MDIKLLSTQELLKDEQESLADILVCKNALNWGVYKYSGGSVTKRIEINHKIIRKIEKELERRKIETDKAK